MTDWMQDEGLLETFRTELDERLASLSEGLLSLEARPDDPETLAQLFRDAHTIKGSARMMGFMAVKEVAHRMEDILGDIKEARLHMTPPIADLLLAGVDLIPQLTGADAMSNDLPQAAQDMVVRLESARGGGALQPASASAVPSAGAPTDWKPGGATAPPAEAPPGRAAVTPPTAPVPAAPPPPSPEPVAAALEPRAAPAGDRGAERAKPEHDDAASSSIRIDVGKVYDLIDLVGEAAVAHVRSRETLRSMVALMRSFDKRMRRAREGRGGSPDDARRAMSEVLDRLSDLIDVLDDSVAGEARGFDRLQEQVMKLAMLPTASIFAPYPRIVRDLSRDLGKEVDLHMDGGGTELDKQVLERIVDPLRHLLINSVDHGIEQPDEREAAGKSRRGTVWLRARQKGRQVVIEIEDDGKGIDPQRVKETARRRGVIAADEEISDTEALNLLFLPGFSTARLVTDLSGRGVGLDVVKTAVDQLKGAVEVESTLGQGTRFLVTLPTTLAIVEGVMVTCGGQSFAVPVSAVEEVVAVPQHELNMAGGRDTAVLRGKTTPVVSLARVLNLPPDNDPWGPVVVITTATRRVGFRVGSVQGQREVVIKGLGSFLPRVRHVAGATISGDGTVVLVLDPFELVDAARRLPAATAVVASPGAKLETPATARRVLVVDDSLAIREMNRSILEGAGYKVDTASDGAEALSRLAQAQYDGVVTDVEMPRLDGFELTARVRADPSLSRLPVIILTSLVREEDRKKGLEVGADAYLTKSGFDQNLLVEVIGGLVRAGGRRP